MKSLLLSLSFLLQFTLFSANTLTVDSLVAEVNLSAYCYHFEDTSDVLSVNQLKNINWDKLNGPISFPVNNHLRWLKFSLRNEYNKSVQKVLFIPYHLINTIEVYTKVGATISPIAHTGIHNSFRNKDIESMGYPIYIDLKENTATMVFIRLNYLYRPLRATTFLMSEKRVRKVIEKSNAIVWFWRGMFFFALFISLVFYWFVRLKLFWYYFLLNLGVGLFIASQIGDYFLFFDKDPTNITTVIDFTGALLINLFLPQFLNELTPIKNTIKQFGNGCMALFMEGLLSYSSTCFL